MAAVAAASVAAAVKVQVGSSNELKVMWWVKKFHRLHYKRKICEIDFPQNATSVVYVSFDSKKNTGKTTTIVEMLKEKSILASGLPSDSVYKHLNIWVGNSGFATPKNLENAVLCFKVENSGYRIINRSIFHHP